MPPVDLQGKCIYIACFANLPPLSVHSNKRKRLIIMVIVSHALLALAAFVPAIAARPSQGCRKVQHDFPAGTNKNDSRAEAVKQAYVREWNQYYKYAFPQDDLLPLTHNGTNDLFGWGASVVDGIDTAIVMGLTDIVEKQLKHIASIDFT
jgi:mannosyl-oligosaccharide alpha-1,2-mannosidase